MKQALNDKWCSKKHCGGTTFFGYSSDTRDNTFNGQNQT